MSEKNANLWKRYKPQKLMD